MKGRGSRFATIAQPAERAFYVMPNIKQQKKRVRIATRERLENLRYRSTVKTLTRRLQSAVAEIRPINSVASCIGCRRQWLKSTARIHKPRLM